MKSKKVLVSGCYDLLHGGHIAFFKTAAEYGELYVSIGRDENLLKLKGKNPVFSQEERLYIVNSVKYVKEAFLASGSGMLDFEPDLARIKPNIFIVNTDGHTIDKENLCIPVQALSGRRLD
jgi:cytidyltransferase-like protein